MSATAEAEIVREPLTKKVLAADDPTWCPGCGDFSVLALYFKLIQNRGLHQEMRACDPGFFFPAAPKVLDSWDPRRTSSTSKVGPKRAQSAKETAKPKTMRGISRQAKYEFVPAGR